MKYSKEFKEEALKLSDEIGVKKAATQLGLHYYTLAEWRKNRKSQVYDVIDNLEINEYTLNNGYNLIDENPEAYMALYTLGYESIPYILKYVIEFDERGMFGAFLVSCANQIAGQDMMVGSIGSNYVAECNYEPYSPRWYACQLMLFLYNN